MIPHEYIEELTRRTDIVELVGSYVQLKRKGRLYGGLCPFHSEKTPSFYVPLGGEQAQRNKARPDLLCTFPQPSLWKS